MLLCTTRYDREQPSSIGLSRTGERLALGLRKGIHVVEVGSLWELGSKKTLLPSPNAHWDVGSLEWNPHPARASLIASSLNQSALVWDADDAAKPLQSTLQAHTRPVGDLAWSAHDPNLLATCSADPQLRVWDVRSPGAPSKSITCGPGGVQVKWNRRSGHLLASAHEGTIRVWDLRRESGALVSINAHLSKIHGVDWCPHREQEILSCGQDGTVKFWTLNSPRECAAELLLGVPVWRAKYTPFGEGLVTAAQRGDCSVRLWSLADLGQPVHIYSGHGEPVRAFDWRPARGEWQLASLARDHTLNLWRVPPHLIAACCPAGSGRSALRGPALTPPTSPLLGGAAPPPAAPLPHVGSEGSIAPPPAPIARVRSEGAIRAPTRRRAPSRPAAPRTSGGVFAPSGVLVCWGPALGPSPGEAAAAGPSRPAASESDASPRFSSDAFMPPSDEDGDLLLLLAPPRRSRLPARWGPDRAAAPRVALVDAGPLLPFSRELAARYRPPPPAAAPPPPPRPAGATRPSRRGAAAGAGAGVAGAGGAAGGRPVGPHPLGQGVAPRLVRRALAEGDLQHAALFAAFADPAGPRTPATGPARGRGPGAGARARRPRAAAGGRPGAARGPGERAALAAVRAAYAELLFLTGTPPEKARALLAPSSPAPWWLCPPAAPAAPSPVPAAPLAPRHSSRGQRSRGRQEGPRWEPHAGSLWTHPPPHAPHSGQPSPASSGSGPQPQAAPLPPTTCCFCARTLSAPHALCDGCGGVGASPLGPAPLPARAAARF
eukprot:tig00000241_g20976.t1